MPNKNNLGTDKLLRLFRFQDGAILPPMGKLDTKLNELIVAEEIFNGDTVILEYVPDNAIVVEPKLYAVK